MLKQEAIVFRHRGCVICLELHAEYLLLRTELHFHGCSTIPFLSKERFLSSIYSTQLTQLILWVLHFPLQMLLICLGT